MIIAEYALYLAPRHEAPSPAGGLKSPALLGRSLPSQAHQPAAPICYDCTTDPLRAPPRLVPSEPPITQVASSMVARLFLQLACILITVAVAGRVARWLGQPHAVGEMLAGVVLGPSVLGLLLPALQRQLFPAELRPALFVLSQCGLVLYMFLVGLELDLALIGRRARGAVGISLAGVVAPCLIGYAVASTLTSDPRLFPPAVAGWAGALFIGAAMAITAFPMLARIIYERGLSNTPLGTLALAAAAVDDVIAWCLLAVVIASLSGNPLLVALAIGGAALYAVGVLTVGRALLRRIWGDDGEPKLVFALILLLLAAWTTESVGIHTVFGAFIFGVALPRGAATKQLQRQIAPLTTSLLLPLYFVYSGLNMQLGLLTTPDLWALCLLMILAACLGKAGACWLAARLSGETNRDALALGGLMNARGLVELIILNIGLERGIITPTLFTIMALMALTTTLIAAPALSLAYAQRPGADGTERARTCRRKCAAGFVPRSARRSRRPNRVLPRSVPDENHHAILQGLFRARPVAEATGYAVRRPPTRPVSAPRIQ